MNILDLIVLAILIIGALVGWKRGAIPGFLTLVGSLVIFVLAFYLKGPVSVILYENFPFPKTTGILSGISSFNIMLYQSIAYFICVVVLEILFKIVLKLSVGINKLINDTVILALPNKLLGALFNTLRYYIFGFLILFLASLIPASSEYINNSIVSTTIINKTPVLSYVTKNFNESVNEIYDVVQKYNNEEDKKEADAEVLAILIKYNVISRENMEVLFNQGKLNIESIESIDDAYNRITNNESNNVEVE